MRTYIFLLAGDGNLPMAWEPFVLSQLMKADVQVYHRFISLYCRPADSSSVHPGRVSSVDLCCKLWNSPRIPPSASVFLFMSSICSQLSSFLCLFPSSPPPSLSAIFFSGFCFLFFTGGVQSQRLTAFPHKQPNLYSLFIFSCMFICGFSWGTTYLREKKKKRPGAGAFPLGMMAAWGKNSNVFFGKWN